MQYVYGLASEADYTRRGSLFHRARELYIGALWKTRQRSDFEAAETAWRQAATELPLPYAMYLDAREIWQGWTERYELNLTTFFAVETDIASHFGARLKLDEVHVPDADTIRIVDAKTYWTIPNAEELRTDFQTACYLAAVRKLFPGFRNREMVYDFPRYGKQVTVALTDAELDEVDAMLEAQTAAMAEAEAEQVYPALPGSHCGRCAASCPVADDPDRVPLRVTTAAEATEAVAYLAVMERDQSRVRAALRAFTAEHGPVGTSGLSAGHWTQERRVYPLVPVAGVLVMEGLEKLNLTVSENAVRKVTRSKRKYAAAADQINALAVVSTETEFGVKRVAQTKSVSQDSGEGRAATDAGPSAADVGSDCAEVVG
jgi:CRISPR/Cas system-associated exonuclease Cas4 (RecB family)